MSDADKPVAWMDIDSDGNRLTVRQWSDGNRDEVPLYINPPQRRPMTDEQIEEVFFDMGQFAKIDLKAFARAIERAHGIGGEK